MSYNTQSNTFEPNFSYVSPLDIETSIVTPIQPKKQSITVVKKDVSESKPIPKLNKLKVILIVTMIFFLIILFMYILIIDKTCPLILEYEKKMKSGFTNKDQYEDNNDYDINYLVEQMIYKEFSPSDKKKYLNLPQVLKEQLMIDYLIQKI